MTRNVDLDRLADYVGGALVGTSDANAVARLVATHPQWARAHTELVAAEALVRADLAVLAAEPEPMPERVVARLAAAFETEPPLQAPLPEQQSRPHLSAVPGGRVDPVPPAVRRPWRAVAAVGVATVLVGLGGIGLAQVVRHGSSSVDSAAGTSSESRAVSPSSAGTGSGYAAAEVRASGLDYDPGMLATLGEGSVHAQGTAVPKTEPRPNVLDAPPQPTSGPSAVPDPLRRLTGPGAEAACLNAVLAHYGGTATLLDYARFQGSPALIVVLDGARGATGHKWVVAVGPTCGSGGEIADQRYSGPVG